MAEEIEALLAEAERQGFYIETDERGYRHVYTEAGNFVKRQPCTPGRKARRYTEMLVALRANGLIWPPLSKKEQRSQRRRKESS